MNEIVLRFDGPPGSEGPRFVEAENEEGESVRVGKWEEDGDYWLLHIDVNAIARERIERWAQGDEDIYGYPPYDGLNANDTYRAIRELFEDGDE